MIFHCLKYTEQQSLLANRYIEACIDFQQERYLPRLVSVPLQRSTRRLGEPCTTIFLRV